MSKRGDKKRDASEPDQLPENPDMPGRAQTGSDVVAEQQQPEGEPQHFNQMVTSGSDRPTLDDEGKIRHLEVGDPEERPPHKDRIKEAEDLKNVHGPTGGGDADSPAFKEAEARLEAAKADAEPIAGKAEGEGADKGKEKPKPDEGSSEWIALKRIKDILRPDGDESVTVEPAAIVAQVDALKVDCDHYRKVAEENTGGVDHVLRQGEQLTAMQQDNHRLHSLCLGEFSKVNALLSAVIDGDTGTYHHAVKGNMARSEFPVEIRDKLIEYRKYLGDMVARMPAE